MAVSSVHCAGPCRCLSYGFQKVGIHLSDHCCFAKIVLHEEQYMLHLSQFRPGDGTLCLLESYGKSRELFSKKYPGQAFPKLLICHHGPFRSPESSMLYDAVMTQLDNIESLASSVCIIPIGALDQMWNALVTNAVALVQLSTLHGVPELLLGAIQKETLVISIREAELFPFVRENKNAVLVNPADTDAIAQDLVRIFGDEQPSSKKVFTRNSKLADEYTTVGNALSWMYLASKLSRGDKFEPRGGSINGLAIEEAEFYDFD